MDVQKALVSHLHFVFNDGEVGAAILGARFSAWNCNNHDDHVPFTL
jgi:hypothetical protein